MSDVLNRTVSAFNNRNFTLAGKLAAEGLASAQGRDELFWMGLLETCEGYDLLARKEMLESERKLIAAMHKLRNFGFRYRNFEITVALAGGGLQLVGFAPAGSGMVLQQSVVVSVDEAAVVVALPG